jgi:heme-degrading monooxygenase HmoA
VDVPGAVELVAVLDGVDQRFLERQADAEDVVVSRWPGVEGLLDARLLRPQGEGGVYVAVMDFVSKDAFTAWMKSASFRAAHQSSSPGMAGEVESFETVVAVGA